VPAVEEAEAKAQGQREVLSMTESAVNSVNDQIAKLREQLRLAEKNRDEAQNLLLLAEQAVDAAKQNTSTITQWQDTLKSLGEAEAPPTDETIVAASEAVTECRKAIEAGAVARQAQKQLDAAEGHILKASELAQKAEILRNAASSVDRVLSDQIAKLGCKLRVEGGRLVLNTDRGVELFSDLSDGERWKVALDIAIDAVGEHGLIVCPQGSWEGMNHPMRKLVAEHVAGRGVVLLTAEVNADEELKADVFKETSNGQEA